MQYSDILPSYVVHQIGANKLVELDRQTEFPSGLGTQ